MDFDLLNAVSYLEKVDGIIALPFKNRYVLVCRVEHHEALQRLYRLSCTQHDWQPVLLGYDLNALLPFIHNPSASALRLMEHYWPGNLIIRLSMGVHLKAEWFEPSRLGLMQPNDDLMRDILSLQPGGVLLAVDACRYDDSPTQTAEGLYNSFGDDVDFVLIRDEVVQSTGIETVVSVELDGSLRILRSGEVVLD